MITIFSKNRRTPTAKRRAGAALLNAIENQVTAAGLRRLGATAKALDDWKKRGMPIKSDPDAVADRSEVLVRVPDEAVRLRGERGNAPGPCGGRWH